MNSLQEEATILKSDQLLAIHEAMEILHDPQIREDIFGIRIPIALMHIDGAALHRANIIAAGVLEDVDDFPEEEWQTLYGAAFDAYRAGLERGWRLASTEIELAHG